MTAPQWLNSIIQAFGEGLHIKDFHLSERDVASLRFETGVVMSFEYAYESLSITFQIPCPGDPEQMKRLLIYTQPERRPAFRLRAGYLAKKSMALIATRMPAREATLPALTSVFNELWRMAEDFRRRIA